MYNAPYSQMHSWILDRDFLTCLESTCLPPFANSLYVCLFTSIQHSGGLQLSLSLHLLLVQCLKVSTDNCLCISGAWNTPTNVHLRLSGISWRFSKLPVYISFPIFPLKVLSSVLLAPTVTCRLRQLTYTQLLLNFFDKHTRDRAFHWDSSESTQITSPVNGSSPRGCNTGQIVMTIWGWDFLLAPKVGWWFSQLMGLWGLSTSRIPQSWEENNWSRPS